MITRTDIAAHLEANVRTGYLLGKKAWVARRTPFCRDVPSTGAFETYADMGPAPWPRANAGKAGAHGTDARTGLPKIGQINAGQQVTVIGGNDHGLIVYNRDFETVIAVTHNAINDDKAGDLENWATGAGVNFEKYKDWLAFNALNNGEATTVLGAGYDGLSLFNNAHIDPGAEYQTGQDNLFNLALSLANFNTVRIAGAGFLDGRGQPAGYNHNLLIHATALRDPAAQIIKNPFKEGTANRDVNPYAGDVAGLEAPGGWVDATFWCLVDTSLPIKPLMLQVRQEAQLSIWDDELAGDGGVRYYKFHARGEILPADWRLIIEGNT